MKKTKLWIVVRRALLALTAVFAFVFLAIIAVVNLFLTNGRLMPIIKGYATEYLDADVSIAHAEGAFFRSFPYVGVKLDSCVIVSNAFHHRPSLLADSVPAVADSLRMRRDTLAQVDHLIVGLNLVKYLFGGGEDVNIGLVRLERPRLRLITDSAGRAGWDVLRPSGQADTSSSSRRVSVGHFCVTDGRVAYFSRPDQMGLFIDSLNLNIGGDLALDCFDADIDFDARRVSLGHKDVRYLRKMPVGLSGRVAYDGDSLRYDLGDVCLKLASADIDLDGWIRPDSTGAYVNVNYCLNSPSAEKLFAAIPKSVVSTPVEVKQGAVDLKGAVVGRASASELPVISGKAFLDKIRAQYEGRPDEIEDVTADFNMLIDKSLPDSSYVNLDIFHFKGGRSEISAVVRVSRLLSQALMDCDIKAHVDLNNLQRVIPFDNTVMSGIVDANVRTLFSVEDVMRRNYGHAKLDGYVSVDKMCIRNDSLGLDVDVKASLTMKTDRVIEVKSVLESLQVKAGRMALNVRNGKVDVRSAFLQDTMRIVPLTGNIQVSRAFFRADSIAVFAKNIRTTDHLEPVPDMPSRPMATHDLRVDTVFAGIIGNRTFGRGLHISAHQSAVSDTSWHTSAILEYDHLGLKSPVLSLPVKTDDIRISLHGDSVAVERVKVRVGRSSLAATGHIGNLFSSLKRRKPMLFNIQTVADTIDCNQILASIVTDSAAMARQVSAEALDTVVVASVADSVDVALGAGLPPTMILVPRHIMLSVDARVGTFLWDKLSLSNVRGVVKTKGGAAHMTNLSFSMGSAKTITTLAYKAWPHARKARANIFSRWERADIATLTSALHLDSLLPALKPMKGKLDCYFAAEVELDSSMTVVPSTARAAIHLGGQKLTLMENDDFRKIGKKLMFKNKDKNVIDTLSLNVLLDSGRVQVLPFVVNIDRYRLAIGGSQDLNMNMKYHISVLKSPLPFKAGVNIVGSPSNFNVDITTAKLKKQVTTEKMARNDTASLMMRMAVLRDSYILSGQPMPDFFKTMKGLDANPRFAVVVESDEATEEEIREAERARRAQLAEAVPDSASVSVSDSSASKPLAQ